MPPLVIGTVGKSEAVKEAFLPIAPPPNAVQASVAVVLPVPPCAIANVPLTGSALAADPSNVTGELELYAVPRATYKLRAVFNFVAVPALPLVSAALSGMSAELKVAFLPIAPPPRAVHASVAVVLPVPP